jgi:aldose sugar dehydrogenase
MIYSVFMLAQAATAAANPAEPRVEVVATGLNRPWGVVWLPNGDMLVTEKMGGLRRVRGGRLDPRPVAGAPDALKGTDGGLLDIALDPDFAANGFVYLSFSEGTAEANRTALWKARWDGERLVGGRVIFRARPDKEAQSHFGSRLLFLPDKTLLMTIGEGYAYRDKAQDLGTHLGKVVRLDREGRTPADNPFVGRAGALPEIYSYGHRNPQGLARDMGGEVWLLDHGPQGGDEINLLKPGGNYGWPIVTYGIDYDGTLVSGTTAQEGVEKPHVVWVPSIAPSGMVVYSGRLRPDWTGQHFVGALAARELRRVGIEGAKDMEQQRLLSNRDQRIRDVREGPDGALYLLTDDEDGQLLRVVPRS